jgi:DNA-directed RNA polymerase subunit RPC12/RpoP
MPKSGYYYFCEDCLLPFTVYKKPQSGKKYFCPYCGDSVEVRVYKGEHKNPGKKNAPVKWTEEETEIVREVIEGKRTLIEAAHLLGRSVGSVDGKRTRVKEAEY